MDLLQCRLCRGLYTGGGRDHVCPKCIRRLEELYSHVHEYMRDHEEEDFDIHKLSEQIEANPVDIQALVDLGYIERDIGLYGKRKTKRSRLAEKFNDELVKMQGNKPIFYGGKIYERGYEREN